MTKADSPKPPTKLETITLKAFLHCEGCRRKIRRIIRVLDGVEDVLVDSATGKVTVTGAGIDVKIILQRLQKYGKQAEVWPSANAVPLNATSKSAGGSQPKPPNNNINDTTPKKKSNPAGESGGTKPVASPSSNESKKGGGKKEGATPATDQKCEEAAVPGEKKAEKSKPEKSKESPDAAICTEASDASTPQPNGSNGGGGGKKGKKGGNGTGPNGGGGGGGGGDGGGSIMPELPPPHIAHDRPIASIPTTSITVSANKGLAPHDYIQTGYSEYNSVDYATHMFSDENANNCSIM